MTQVRSAVVLRRSTLHAVLARSVRALLSLSQEESLRVAKSHTARGPTWKSYQLCRPPVDLSDRDEFVGQLFERRPTDIGEAFMNEDAHKIMVMAPTLIFDPLVTPSGPSATRCDSPIPFPGHFL